MAAADVLLDPALPPPLAWGLLQPIWWLIIAVIVCLIMIRWVRYQRLQKKLQPLRQLISVMQVDDPAQIAYQVKQVLLAYFPAEQVAPLAADKALIFLQQQWQLDDVSYVAAWLARAVYQNDTSQTQAMHKHVVALRQALEATLDSWR
jgi:hypothetical protein